MTFEKFQEVLFAASKKANLDSVQVDALEKLGPGMYARGGFYRDGTDCPAVQAGLCSPDGTSPRSVLHFAFVYDELTKMLGERGSYIEVDPPVPA